MNAALRGWRATDRTYDVWDLIPFSVGGSMLGCFGIAASFLIDAVFLSVAITLSGSGPGGTSSDTWPQWAVVTTGAVAVVVSCIVGRWLFSLRKWIGVDGDPSDVDTIRRKRRHFSVGSMVAYVLLTPAVWAAMLAYANGA